MAKENIGAYLFAGLVGVTGLVSSGAVIDVNPYLERWNTAAIEREMTNAPEDNTQQASPENGEAVDVNSQTVVPETETSTEVDAPSMQMDAAEEAISDGDAEADVTVETMSDVPPAAASEKETPDAASAQLETEPNIAPDQLNILPVVPTFDILRVEPDGSTLVAGIAEPGSEVELVTGANTLTKTIANDRGEFVAVLDAPLTSGDYEIVLRSTAPEGTVMTSTETAIVSIPENNMDEVLALVEAPGAPSRLITKPTANVLVPVSPLEDAFGADGTPLLETDQAGSDEQPVLEADEKDREIASVEPSPQKVQADAAVEEATFLRIEAVEIDGPTVFVAGSAQAGARVRVYANEILLGDTIANPDNRFLIDVNRELPVGDYLIRADVLKGNESDVVARVAVPFKRLEGVKIAAVAVPVAPRLPDAPPVIDSASGDLSDAGDQSESLQAQAEVAPKTNTEQVVGGNGNEEQAASLDKVTKAEPATKVAEPLSPASQSVIIRRGDTLWQISRRVYGRGVKYTTIYAANQEQIKDPDRIWPGQVFALPENADTDG